MASQGEVLPAEGGFKAVFHHQGQQHVVEPLRSAEAAALVLDVLTVHATIASGLPLEASHLRSSARLVRLTRMAGEAGLLLSLAPVGGGRWQDVSLPELVQQLNDCTAVLDAQEDHSTYLPLCTALLRACASQGHLPLVQLLLTLLGDTDAVTELSGSYTAVHAAAEAGHAAVVQYLVAAAPRSTTAMHKGRTPAHVAAACGHVDVLRVLLAASPSSGAVGEPNPLDEAAARGHTAAMAVLLEAAPHAWTRWATLAPLHRAAAANNLAVMQLLLEAAPEILQARAEHGCSVAHTAANAGSLEALRMVVQLAPDLATAADSEGRLPIHHASRSGHGDLVAMLLGQAPPEAAQAVDSNHATPLLLAAEARHSPTPARQVGHTAALQHLLAAAPASASVPDISGNLPLHMAARNGHSAAVCLLLNAAPQAATVQNAAGSTPLDLAVQQQRQQAAEHLIAAGPPGSVLRVLRQNAGIISGYMVAAFVPAHLPLSEQQWEQVACLLRHAFRPADLARALPAALEHSPDQAHQLLRLLPAEQQDRLRTFGLCLAHLQRRLRVPLPGPLAGRIMALFDA